MGNFASEAGIGEVVSRPGTVDRRQVYIKTLYGKVGDG